MYFIEFALFGLFAIINQVESVNVYAAQVSATEALQDAFRTGQSDGWLDAVHTDFVSDSYCVSDFLFPFPSAACIAEPLNATEFFDVNVPLAGLIVNTNTFEWRTNPDPFVKDGALGAVTMTTAFDELVSGLHLENTLVTFVDVALENGKWKVVKWRLMQDTAFEQNLFCRLELSAGLGELSACNVSATPPNNTGVENL